ncbi:LapA family protein [Variovorax sp. W6]|uniref:LapA family protein n=1 Tax=Variovorax sp. W6 TaxID=3093895 RepID=UPI003D8034F8
MKYLLWLLKAAIFFTLFAFALNNQHDATVYFFFGTYWRAPLVLVVLAAFAGGLVVGALGMLPGWWKHRAAAAQAPSTGEAAQPSTPPAATTAVAAAVAAVATPAIATTDLPAARQHGL